MATSGDAVTRKSAIGCRLSVDSTRENASWVAIRPAYVSERAAGGSGISRAGAGGDGAGSRCRSPHSGEPGAKPANSSPASTPAAARSASICAGVSSIEWFKGSPSNGRPQPLIV